VVKKLAILNGDGIGPEVTAQAVKALDAIGVIYNHSFLFSEALIGNAAIAATGSAFPKNTLSTCLDCDAILFGAVGNNEENELQDVKVKARPEQGILAIRKALKLFANLRPITSYRALLHLSPLKASVVENVDILIVREAISGIYFGEKIVATASNAASDICSYDSNQIEQVTHIAFKYAQQRRKKLTLVDKANVLETSRLWRQTVKKIANEYKDVLVEYMFIDNIAVKIITSPEQFDVVLTESLFGDIISSEASLLVGSLGLLPSASIGSQIALFEPVHGTFPKAAGKDIANPIGSILSAAMALEYFGLHKEASHVKIAVEWALDNSFVTRDINSINYYFTSTLGDLIADFILGKIPDSVNPENIELRKSTII
jgi:3-isopropylmalate dehydrogenase